MYEFVFLPVKVRTSAVRGTGPQELLVSASCTINIIHTFRDALAS